MSPVTFFKRLFLLLSLFVAVDFLLSFIILTGILRYYGFGENPNMLINGSSMSMTGFDPNLIEREAKLKVAFYAREGVNVEDRHVMLQHYFSEYPNSVKVVVYEINPLLFSRTSTSENVYTLFYPFIDNQYIRNYINENAKGLEYYIHRWIRCARFDAQLIITSLRGFFRNYMIYKEGVIDSLELSSLKSRYGQDVVSLDKTKMRVFKSSMKLIEKNGASVILVMMPMVYEKNLTFDRKSYYLFCEYFRDFTKASSFRFIDFNIEEITKDVSLFFDPVHLNHKGQQKITAMFNDALLDVE